MCCCREEELPQNVYRTGVGNDFRKEAISLVPVNLMWHTYFCHSVHKTVTVISSARELIVIFLVALRTAAVPELLLHRKPASASNLESIFS